jgi:hypothetical protein
VSSPPCRSPVRRGIRRRTLPSTRSVAKRDGRSRLVPGPLFEEARARGRGSRFARMAAHITYLSTQHCTGNSGAISKTAKRWRSASTPTSRWRAICATKD